MTATLVDRDGREHPRVDRAAVEGRLSAGEPFWLDIHAPDESDLALLREVFRFHPLAVEDTQQFGQRAKLVDFGDFVFLVLYGAAPAPDDDRLVEVHCFYSERFLVTVRRDESPGCDALRERYSHRPAQLERPIVLLYRLVDELADSFFPVLEELDDRIDRLQDSMLAGATEEHLHEILAMRRRIIGLRRALSPQRDLFAQLVGGRTAIAGLDEEAERYFRDVYDHLIRLSEMIDSYRDLLTGAMDVYLSTVSNRLNLIMKRLTVISTIFLPLIVLTGFFGQNFGWLVDGIDSPLAFVLLGLVLPVAFGALLVVVLRRFRLL